MRHLRTFLTLLSSIFSVATACSAQAPRAELQAAAVSDKTGFTCHLELITPEVHLKTGYCTMIIRMEATGEASFPDVSQNPFLDPARQSICQIAVFDSGGLYLGNLLRWSQNRHLSPPISQTFYNVINASSVGRVVRTPAIIEIYDERNRRSEQVLTPGTYQLRAIVYQSFLGGDARVICATSDLTKLRVITGNDQYAADSERLLNMNEFYVCQKDQLVRLEYRNLSNEHREIGQFGFYPLLDKSPGYTILTSLNDKQYSTEPIRHSGLSEIEFKPDRQYSAVIPPFGLIAVDANISDVTYFSPVNAATIQYVATKAFFNHEFYVDPENPYAATPNDTVYAMSNVLRLTKVVPARNPTPR